jgi:WD40 repeat protein
VGRIGEYELIEEIARGGMGIVYRAWQRSLDRTVAVKTLLFGPQASPEFTKRFRAEAAAAASLHHPNIVAIHEVGVYEGRHYLVMDLVEGRNLQQALKERPLPARRAAECLKTIAEAVHHAHEHGILHRDLKPSNILMDAGGQPHVTDFGLAKRFDGDGSLTLTGQVLGSPSYMPPEQAGAGRGKVGRRSDVYSLGAMLYHMVTGRPPFVGETMNKTLDEVFHREPLSPRLLNAGVPRDLETICLKCLTKEPEKRYPTAQALAEELGRFLAGEPIRARPVGQPERLWRWCRRKPALATLLILLQVVGTLGVAGILWQWRRAEQLVVIERGEAYAADMSVAGKALEAGNLGQVRRLLDRYRPPTNSALRARQSASDLRGWEWRYLWERSRGDEMFTLLRAQGAVLCLAFSPDGRFLASADNRGTMWLCDYATRKKIASRASTDAVMGGANILQFSADGHRLVSAGYRCGLRVWEWNAPLLQLHQALLSETTVFGVWLGDSELMAVDLDSKLRRRWELPGGRELAEDPITCETRVNEQEPWSIFSVDGRLLATSTNNVILLWETRTATLRASLTNHTVLAHPLAFSRDGRILASGDANGGLKLWDTETGKALGSESAHQLITEHADFSPDGKLLVTCSYDHTLKLWEVSPLQEVGVLRGHLGEVFNVRFAPDGESIASASADGTVKVWKPESRIRERHFQELPPDLRLWSLAPDGQWLLLLFTDQTFSLWDLRDEKSWLASGRRPLGASNLTACVLFTGGQTVAFGHADGEVTLHETATLRGTTRLTGFDAAVTALGCSFDGRTLAAQSTNRLMKVWALPAGRELGSFTRTNHIFYDRVPVSRDGRTVVTASMNGAVEFWTLPDHHANRLQASEDWYVPGVALFRDRQHVATCSVDNSARIWDLRAPGKPIVKMYSDLGGFRSLALSPDERRLAVGGDLGGPIRKVKIFDVATGREVAVLAGNKESIADLAFWPDGNVLVSVSRDAVYVWRAPSWKKIATEEQPAAGGP